MVMAPMDDGSYPAGRFGVTARLFSLVDEMPRERQLVLLKQLARENVATLLFKLVLEMSDKQRQRLLEQLVDTPIEEAPVVTLDLNDSDAFMRQMPRRACLLKAICVVGRLTFEAQIADLSTVGMFIKTDRSLPAGSSIRLSFRLPDLERALVIEGDVSRSEPDGIGVRIRNLKAGHEKAIRSFIENRAG
jgi:hypothetical protein